MKAILLVFILILFVLILSILYIRYDPLYGFLNKKRDPLQYRYWSFFKQDYHKHNAIQVSPFKIINEYNTDKSHTKIISMSLYGNDPKYFDKLDDNIQFVNTYLPEWTLRIYLHDQVDHSLRNTLIESGIEVYIVEDRAVEPGKSAGAFWRFLPLCEDVDVVVLDADDYITNDHIKNIHSFFNDSKYLIKGKWVWPWPKEHIQAKDIFKKRSLQLPFDKHFIQTYPHRYEFGEDEIFLTKHIGKTINNIERPNDYWLSIFMQKDVL